MNSNFKLYFSCQIPSQSLTVRPWKVTNTQRRKPDMSSSPTIFQGAFAVKTSGGVVLVMPQKLRQVGLLGWVRDNKRQKNRGLTVDGNHKSGELTSWGKGSLFSLSRYLRLVFGTIQTVVVGNWDVWTIKSMITTPKGHAAKNCSSWWFQPPWKILVKMEIFPK